MKQGTCKIYGRRAFEICEGYIGQLLNWHREAQKYGQTSQWISRKIERYVYEDPTFKRLANRQRGSFGTIRMVMFQQWQRDHIWTHVINGHRVHSGHPSVEGNYDQLNVPLEESLSYHCQGYLIPSESNRIVFVPVNDDDVAADIAAGRLMQDHLDMIRNQQTPRISQVSNRKLQTTIDLNDLTVPAWQIPEAA